MYHIFFMDLLVDRHLGRFHLLASVNSALANVEEDVSLRDCFIP